MSLHEENETCDEVLREVRQIKEKLAESMDFDIHRMCEEARKNQRASGKKIVPPPVRNASGPMNIAMKKDSDDERRPEDDLDYARSKPNRFAPRMGETRIMVSLDPDVAEVFTSADAVNAALRGLIQAERKRIIR